VHDQVDRLLFEDSPDFDLVAQVGLVKRDIRRNGLSVTEDQIVQDHRAMPGRLQLSHAMTSNVSSSAND
jgi:hypothetical protein